MNNALLLTVAAVLATAPFAGAADTPAPFPDFTFKMGKPPEPGATRRITVQIEPPAMPAPRPKQPEAAETPGETITPARYDWFWQEIPSGFSDEAALRMEAALQRLAQPPAGAAVPRPRLQALQEIALAQGQNILTATIGTDVSPALVLAVISVESGGRKNAESHKGAQGLMQLIPATAERFGVSDSLSEAENIRGGVAYLDWLLKEFKGDPILALAGYNAGENAVKNNNGVPPYAETRDYVPKVLAAYDVARGLCKTRPEFISDGCALSLALND